MIDWLVDQMGENKKYMYHVSWKLRELDENRTRQERKNTVI